jgi:hypothetical protein
MRKTAFLKALLALVTLVCVLASSTPMVLATDGTTPAAFDPSFLIQMGLVFGGIGTLAFVIAELIGMYVTKSAQTSIVQTTSTAINAIVAMTGVGVTASQAAAITETSAMPTQIPTSPQAQQKTT